MRFISTKAHAAVDYLAGILLIVVPLFWLGADVPAAAIWTPVVIGVLMLAQSLFTDYEYSISDAIPVPVHLGVDAVAGILLAVSPWLFGFAEVVWLPHLIVGLLEVAASATTKLHREEPSRRGPDRHVAA